MGGKFENRLGHLQAVHTRHADVCKHNIGLLPADHLQSFFTVKRSASHLNAILLPLGLAGDHVHHAFDIVDHANFNRSIFRIFHSFLPLPSVG
ncbi:hypothetical protein D3C75_1133120 [compost metagenome]